MIDERDSIGHVILAALAAADIEFERPVRWRVFLPTFGVSIDWSGGSCVGDTISIGSSLAAQLMTAMLLDKALEKKLLRQRS